MATPEVFATRMKKLSFRIEGNVEKGMRKAVLAIDNALVSSTPVDTGRARSNWLANLDAPASGTTKATVPSGRTAQTVARFKLGANTAIHLTNNLPYIKALNDGSSQQQPAGFVRRAIFAGIGAVKSIKLLKG